MALVPVDLLRKYRLFQTKYKLRCVLKARTNDRVDCYGNQLRLYHNIKLPRLGLLGSLVVLALSSWLGRPGSVLTVLLGSVRLLEFASSYSIVW
jgi:hypothetical protein